MPKELRCRNTLQGIILDDGIIEIACKSRFCGAVSGVAVLHRYDAKSGALLETKMYKTPRKGNEKS